MKREMENASMKPHASIGSNPSNTRMPMRSVRGKRLASLMGGPHGSGGHSSSGPENLNFIGLQEPVMGHEGQSFSLRLRYEHAIERVSVMGRKTAGAFGVGEGDDKLLKPAGENTNF